MSEQQGGTVVGMNDQRASTGNASRFNAIKHGLTAKTPVLPGEDPAELQAKIDAYRTGHKTRNEAEGDLAKLAAMAYWRAMRANRLEVFRVTGDMVRRSRAEALREADAVIALGERLLFDRRGPEQLYPSRDYEHKEPRTSWSGEADDPDKPGRLVLQLEATRAGRRWLRERLGEVRKPIDSGEGWVSCQKFMALRLPGKQPLDALFDREAALVFLASHAIRPAFKSAFRELRCEIHYDRVKFHEGQLTRPELRAITPSDAGAGLAVLLAIIDKAIERLWRLEAENAEADEILELAELIVGTGATLRVPETRAELAWVKRRPTVGRTAGSETRAELRVWTAATLPVPETRAELVAGTGASLQVPESPSARDDGGGGGRWRRRRSSAGAGRARWDATCRAMRCLTALSGSCRTLLRFFGSTRSGRHDGVCLLAGREKSLHDF